MEIYLMQHGDCLTKQEDPEQPLSENGKEKIITTARAIKRMGLKFNLIVTSPKRRAKQSAEIVAPLIDFPIEEIKETEMVKPMTPPLETIKYLEQYAALSSILVVGHLPSLAEVASFLLTEGTKVAIHFERGGIGRIDVGTLPSHRGELRWYLTPELLQLIT